ncbi:2-oxoacid dehydrogenases acyltransferase-domain-containing protein [Scenedesmus sp. NREL 46B-D3]|nr:2-oxoacid dehydrogenases acyltransferase-domain-containing protein [Scenedesmus sp. NREL 46B-D3]
MFCVQIAKWYVKVGDEIAAGTVLADIETDKATLAFENQEDGFIAAIVKGEGSKDVPVGETVAVIVEEEADVAAFASYSGGDAAAAEPAPAAAPGAAPAAAEAAPAAAAAAAPAAAGSFPEHIVSTAEVLVIQGSTATTLSERLMHMSQLSLLNTTPLVLLLLLLLCLYLQALQMPALSPTMEQGNIVSWQVKEGDEIAPGTVLAEIETDKATLAFENQDEGFVAKILAPAGSKDIKVGQVVAIIVENEADIPAFASYSPGGAAAAPAAAAPAAAGEAAPAAAAPKVQANFRLGPAARVALEQAGLTVDDIAAPTGPNGIITKADVLAAVAAGVKRGSAAAAAAPPAAADKAAAAPAAAQAAAKPAAAKPAAAPAAAASSPAAGETYTDTPNTQVRKVIAKRLLESKLTAPSLYVTADVRLDKLEALRASLKAGGAKLSVNDFVVRAAALALRDVPAANASWDGAGGAAVQQPSVDVCVAVATEGGLITPIVKGADGKALSQISAEVKELAGKARSNKLQPHEFMGGTFTISNLGMYGLSNFSAIINPPQAAILAVGGAQKRVGFGPGASGALASESYMTVTLSADHRVFDGELATRLLDAFTKYMENPVSMVV